MPRAIVAGVAELVDAAGLGPAAARRGGSSPFTRTSRNGGARNGRQGLRAGPPVVLLAASPAFEDARHDRLPDRAAGRHIDRLAGGHAAAAAAAAPATPSLEEGAGGSRCRSSFQRLARLS